MDQTDWQIMQQEMRNAGAKIYNNRFTDPIPGSAYVLIYRVSMEVTLNSF